MKYSKRKTSSRKMSKSKRSRHIKKSRRVTKSGGGIFTDRLGQFTMRGKEIKCPHCGKDTFKERRVQLAGRWKQYWGFGVFNQRARALRCCYCTYIVWFNDKPDGYKKETDKSKRSCHSSGLL